MREEIRDRERIIHMIDAINQIESAENRFSHTQLVSDPILFYGLVKWVEIIGEAAYKTTLSLRESNPQIPWTSIIGMRHVLVHGYYQIKPDRLLDTIKTDLVPLRAQLLELIAAYG